MSTRLDHKTALGDMCTHGVIGATASVGAASATRAWLSDLPPLELVAILDR